MIAASCSSTRAGGPEAAMPKATPPAMARSATALNSTRKRELPPNSGGGPCAGVRLWLKSGSRTARDRGGQFRRQRRLIRPSRKHRAHDKRADPALRAPPRTRLLAGLAFARGLARGLRTLRNGPLQRGPVPAVRGDLPAERRVPFGSVRLGADRQRLRACGVQGTELVQALLLGGQGRSEGLGRLAVVHRHHPQARLQLADLNLRPGQLEIDCSSHYSLSRSVREF